MDFWVIITLLGSPQFWAGFSLFLVGLYFFARGYNRKMPHFKAFLKLMIPALFITLLLVQGMKTGFAVPRPCTPCDLESSALCNPYCPDDYSFPSGHAAIMFSVFTAAMFTVGRKYRIQIILGYIIALIVALSRIMLGVHTYADILGGAIVGFAVTYLMLIIMKKYKLIKTQK